MKITAPVGRPLLGTEFRRDYVIWFLEQDAKRQKLSMRLLFASKRAGEANRAGQMKRADRMQRIIGRLYDRITELEGGE